MNGAGKSGNQGGMVDAAFDRAVRDLKDVLLAGVRGSATNTFEAALPAHKAGLYLAHNKHKGYHETAQQYLEGLMDWEIGPETRRQCIEADSIWELQWYPETSVGFYKVYGPTLESVLSAAKEVK